MTLSGGAMKKLAMKRVGQMKKAEKMSDQIEKGDNELTKDTNDMENIETQEAADSASHEEENSNLTAELERKLEIAESQSSEYLDLLKRKAAEFENYKKRTAREMDALSCEVTGSVISKFLEIADNLSSAVENVKNEKKSPLKDGLTLIARQMDDVLKSLDVKAIEAVGKEFDPDLHYALMHVEDESLGKNIVAEELKKGYTYKGNVIRHSFVKVAN